MDSGTKGCPSFLYLKKVGGLTSEGGWGTCEVAVHSQNVGFNNTIPPPQFFVYVKLYFCYEAPTNFVGVLGGKEGTQI